MKLGISIISKGRARRPRAVWSVILPVLALGLTSYASLDRRTPITDAVEKSMPAVVNIGTERMVELRYADPFRRFRGDLFDQFFRDFFGPPALPGYKKSHSLGSGAVVDPHGYILTNYHVIQRASIIRVMLSDDRLYDARFIAGDEISDLALIKIDPEEPLPSLPLASDDDLILGETVIALGNPFGLAHTVTVGVLSAKNREARYGSEVLYRDILQTDAAINPGNSGGPLLNINGELIGINVAIYQQAQNIGFAVPIKRARALLAGWLSPRTLGHLWLGFDAEADEQGVRVAARAPEGPAAKAGLDVGDRIVALNNEPVDDLLTWHRRLLNAKPGEDITLNVAHGDETRTVALHVAAAPEVTGVELARRLFGIQLGDATQKRSLQVIYPVGLPITEVDPDSPAAQAGLRPGLLVTRINDRDIACLDDVQTALTNARPGESVALNLVSIVERGSLIVAQASAVPLVAR